ncbi:unnamed protein product [Cuscuta europaea]|uniref:Uncharacterized protein n=1 Tax=Cuscuta europaea TaxID=41803 RepID=A0A9P0ZC01_CUSEU|nr:unnamed protein product [Cuscuta europaea]
MQSNLQAWAKLKIKCNLGMQFKSSTHKLNEPTVETLCNPLWNKFDNIMDIAISFICHLDIKRYVDICYFVFFQVETVFIRNMNTDIDVDVFERQNNEPKTFCF